jgi:cell division protein FtsL
MSGFLAVILIIVIIFFVFNHLNSKIRKLEKEISDLHVKINQTQQNT